MEDWRHAGNCSGIWGAAVCWPSIQTSLTAARPQPVQSSCASADDLRQSLANDHSKTYGFYQAQRLSLERIKSGHPGLARDAIIAQSEFDLVFKSSIENIETQLRSNLGSHWVPFRKDLTATLERDLDRSFPSLDRATVATFIQEVRLRAKGKIESPIIETLLIYQPKFQAVPAAEFTQGFRQIYRTKDHRKAKGIDFQIEYPRSWRTKEGRRPHVIQLFSSENGRGLEYISLMVRDLELPPGALQLHWTELSPHYAIVEEPTVIGIDLTRRSRADAM